MERMEIEEFPLSYYLKVLYVHWKYILFISSAVTLLALGISFVIKPTYKAEATVLPPITSRSNLGKASGLGIISPAIPGVSEALAILKSRSLKEEIVRQFKLDSVYRADDLEAALKKLDKSVKIRFSTDEGVIKIEVLDHDPVRAANIANSFIKGAEKINEDLQIFLTRPMLKIVDEAVPPQEKDRPRRSIFTLIGLVFGVILSVGLAFIKESKRRRVYDLQLMKFVTGKQPILMIPKIKDLDRRIENFRKLWVPKDQIASFVSSFYRKRFDKPTFHIVTSSRSREGKTIASIQLTMILAQCEGKCLLVDFNHLNPCLKDIFFDEIEKEPKEVTFNDDVSCYIIEGPLNAHFDVLVWSNLEKAPMERFKTLLTHKNALGDYAAIILDCPPLLESPDLAKTFEAADMVYITVALFQSYADDLRAVMQVLDNLDIKNYGFIANGVTKTFSF